MTPITHHAYRTDPLIREQLEREVRRARTRAIGRFLARAFRALVRRAPPRTRCVIAGRAA
jgi:hypothetical protein